MSNKEKFYTGKQQALINNVVVVGSSCSTSFLIHSDMQYT